MQPMPCFLSFLIGADLAVCLSAMFLLPIRNIADKLECPLQGASQGRIIWGMSCYLNMDPKEQQRPVQFGTNSVAGVARMLLEIPANRLRDSSSGFFLRVDS